MESNPGNPNPDLTTLWWLILTQYGVIIAVIAFLILLLWLAPKLLLWKYDREMRKHPQSSSVPSFHAQERDPDWWFSDEGQKELFRDFSPN